MHWQQVEAAGGPGSSTEYLEEVTEEDKSLQFVNEWLMAVTDYVVGLFFVQVMKFESLSVKGCFQLAADIGYLVNVASALGILPHPLLLHFKDIFSNGKGAAISILKQSDKLVPGMIRQLFFLIFFLI